MDIGIIIALCVAITLTLVSGILAGLFGGMWWQARKTAEVWEKTYTHLREQLVPRALDTYNVRQDPTQRDYLEKDRNGCVPLPSEAASRFRVRADIAPPPAPPLPPVVPSLQAQQFDLEDDPLGPQVKR